MRSELDQDVARPTHISPEAGCRGLKSSGTGGPLTEPGRCTEPCWTALPCPRCGNSMNPRGRSAPLEMTCLRELCPADDGSVNPRHLWDATDDERWRFYPDERPVDDE